MLTSMLNSTSVSTIMSSVMEKLASMPEPTTRSTCLRVHNTSMIYARQRTATEEPQLSTVRLRTVSGARTRRLQKATDLLTNSSTAFQTTGVAPTCMTLANFFTDGRAPYACGNDCLQYDSLSGEQVGQLLDTLGQLDKV